jgi:hypothetical protein
MLKGESGVDGLATAKALAAELREMNAVSDPLRDEGRGHGPAASWDPWRPRSWNFLVPLPSRSSEVEGDIATCHREVEGGVEIIEVDLPAVITMTKGKVEPRYASLKGIMAAKRKPMEEKPAKGGEPRLTVQNVGLPTGAPCGTDRGRRPRLLRAGAGSAPQGGSQGAVGDHPFRPAEIAIEGVLRSRRNLDCGRRAKGEGDGRRPRRR